MYLTDRCDRMPILMYVHLSAHQTAIFLTTNTTDRKKVYTCASPEVKFLFERTTPRGCKDPKLLNSYWSYIRHPGIRPMGCTVASRSFQCRPRTARRFTPHVALEEQVGLPQRRHRHVAVVAPQLDECCHRPQLRRMRHLRQSTIPGGTSRTRKSRCSAAVSSRSYRSGR